MTKKLKNMAKTTMGIASGAVYGATKATANGVFDILQGTSELVIAPIAAIGGAIAGKRTRSGNWKRIEEYLDEYRETKENEG